MEDNSADYILEKEYSEGLVDFYRMQPKWIVRYGLIILFLFLVIIVVSGSLVSYPDRVNARAAITSVNPPIVIKARIDGIIDSLVTEDSKKVTKDQIIVVLGSAMNTQDFLELRQWMNSGTDSLYPNDLSLGELQEFYDNFLLEIEKAKIKDILEENSLRELRLKNSLNEKKRLLKNLEEKRRLVSAEISLEEKQIGRFSQLHKKGVISDNDLENYQKDLLVKKKSYEDIQVAISTSRLDIIEITKAIDDNTIREREFDLMQIESIRNSRNLLRERMEQWEENYLLKSPINGFLFYHNKPYTAGQNVSIGEEIFAVIPEAHGQLYCSMTRPFLNSGKVEVGQNVKIYLDNYPYQEYGTISGKVSSISSFPNSEGYLVEASIDTPILTSYNYSIDYQPNLIGRSEIVTKDISLINRIFNKFKGIVDNL